MQFHFFTFNPFAENTYVVYDETKECLIIDPGCFNGEEREMLRSFIEKNSLKPVKLINTHCHIDHVLGNRFVADTWKLDLEMNEKDLPVLAAIPEVSRMYGIPCQPSPEPSKFLDEGDTIEFGKTSLDVLFCPGHSPGSIVLLNHAEGIAFAGDVLFRESVGRYDFPGGDRDTLYASIREKLYTLPEHTRILPGHGPETTIGHERKHNPFVKG